MRAVVGAICGAGQVRKRRYLYPIETGIRAAGYRLLRAPIRLLFCCSSDQTGRFLARFALARERHREGGAPFARGRQADGAAVCFRNLSRDV